MTKDGLTHITVDLPLPVSAQCLAVAQRSGMSERAVRDAVREEAEDLLARLLPPPARIISKLYDTIAEEIATEAIEFNDDPMVMIVDEKGKQRLVRMGPDDAQG